MIPDETTIFCSKCSSFNIGEECCICKSCIDKLIDEEKEIVKMVCLGLTHPSKENQKEFTKWLQNTVIFHLENLKKRIQGGSG